MMYCDDVDKYYWGDSERIAFRRVELTSLLSFFGSALLYSVCKGLEFVWLLWFCAGIKGSSLNAWVAVLWLFVLGSGPFPLVFVSCCVFWIAWEDASCWLANRVLWLRRKGLNINPAQNETREMNSLTEVKRGWRWWIPSENARWWIPVWPCNKKLNCDETRWNNL